MSFEKILDAEAKYYLKDIIKIFVVAQALEADAKAALPGFINKDIEKTVIFGPVYGSLYYPHEDHIEDEDDRKAFDDSVEQYNDYKEFVLDTADNFIIDNDYLKAFKKFVGSSSYKSFMESTGEVNVRAGYQLYNILYYLTSTDLLPLDEDRHEESCQPAYTEADAEGNIYLAFRVVEYTIKAADDTTTESDDTTSDSKND